MDIVRANSSGLLWSSTSTLGFDSSLGGILDFELQGLRLLRSSPSGLTRASGFPVRFGGCHQHRLVGAAAAPLAGACTSHGRAPELGADRQSPAAASSAVNESCYTFVHILYSVMLNFVGNGRCSRALD